jgi:small subunit ribosomal protein S2
VAGSNLTKKELLVLRREKDKLAKTLGGIRDMAKVPSAVWIVDTNKEHLAVNEARKLGIPVVAILDTNCDPDVVDYPIPGNDDAIRAVQLLTRVIADAAADGLLKRHSGRTAAAEGADADAEPLAEWERELLEASETPQSTAERIEAVDQSDAAPEVKAEEIAEIVAAETNTEENDADAAALAEATLQADPAVVIHHRPETDDETEARIEAEEVVPTVPTDEAPKPPKAAAKKPAAAKPAAKPAAK